jgi:hypothetical protein
MDVRRLGTSLFRFSILLKLDTNGRTGDRSDGRTDGYIVMMFAWAPGWESKVVWQQHGWVL